MTERFFLRSSLTARWWFSAGHTRPAARRPSATDRRRYDFHWSEPALRKAAIVIAACSVAAGPALLTRSVLLHALAALWLALQAWWANVIARRAQDAEPVITIDDQGVLDRRLSRVGLTWRDISAVAPCDLARSRVFELYVRDAGRPPASARFAIRLGLWCQRWLDLPALTISLLFVDAAATDVARAIAQFRPALLPAGMRPAT